MKAIKIGTRKSALAMAQTRLVLEKLQQVYPALQLELVPITTKGDRILTQPLSHMGGKGVFVSEIEQALQQGKIDLAVHSGKDLPVELGAGLTIAAVLERGDPRDVLVTCRGESLGDKAEKWTVGTGSLRRQRQLKRQYSQAQFLDIRGNVDTRLEKLRVGQYDAIVLAAAGLERLQLDTQQDLFYEKFQPEEFLPAACQGIIAVESRNDPEFVSLLQGIHDPETGLSFAAERQVLSCLGADCTMPAGAYAKIEGEHMTLTVTKDSVRFVTGQGDKNQGIRLAEELVAKL